MMTENSKLTVAIVVAAVTLVGTSAARANPAENKALVMKAMNELFVHRDTTAIGRYWGNPYIQHNPQVGNGADALAPLVNSLPTSSTYEPGMVVADGDLVMLHGRYTGFGPKPLIAVDMFRIKDGKIVEHWDVMQEDVPAAMTKSANPMFSPNE